MIHTDPRDDQVRSHIESLVSDYARSINMADTDLAAQIWLTDETATFIHLRGHERGWEAVKVAFYEQTMRDRFLARDLKVRDLAIYLHGESAVVEFYWVFDAIFRHDGTVHQTKGRETQVFCRVADRWRLAHVHYSGMPVTGMRAGF